MVDFRKLLLAFAAVALLVVLVAPANAQQPFTCSATSNPVQVRAEGLAELMGDIVVSCSGGVPTPAGSFVPQTNFVVGLNTNITSRLFGTGTASGIDALLLIDEPLPTNPNPSLTFTNVPVAFIGKPAITQSSPCLGNTAGPLSSPANCNILPGQGVAGDIAVGPVYGTSTCPNTTNTANTTPCSNIYVAKQQDASHVTWLGVPIDPPGSAGNLILRFTNIRGNANLLGVSSTLTSTSIFANISDNGSQSFQINSGAQVPVATIIPGLKTTTTGAKNLSQCINLNVTNATNFSPGCAEFAIQLTEGFAASFKRRIAPVTFLGAGTIGLNGASAGDGVQNIPGFNYNTESAFTPPSGLGFTQGAFGSLGVADTATRFLLKVNNVGSGVNLVFPIAVPLTVGANSPGSPLTPTSITGWTGGFLRLVAGSPDANGSFGVGGTNGFVSDSGALIFTCFDTTVFGSSGDPFALGSEALTSPLGNPWNEGVAITATGGAAAAVYEVVNADPFATENAVVPIGVFFTSNTSQNIPATGQSTINASFAPLSTVGVADPSASVPRFAPSGTPQNSFNIAACTCNLLFPFVTNQFGFDTGIAIANTSLDPFGTSPQSGTVKLSYYGNTTGGGAAPAAQTSQNVTGGSELIFTLSGGGNLGITAVAGFEGYMIAQANFQYCHAFAFITYNLTQSSGIAEGYLAIQLDNQGPGILNRTGITGESDAH